MLMTDQQQWQRKWEQGRIQQAYFSIIRYITYNINKKHLLMSSIPLSIIHLNKSNSQLHQSHISKHNQTSTLLETRSKNSAHSSCLEQSNSLVNCYLMRHAQSKYNQITKNCQYHINSQQAKNLYQIDRNLIDCQITEKGVDQILSTNFNYQPKCCEQEGESTNQSQSELETKMFDCIYISPLNRVLQTTKLLIQHDKLKYRKIIVVPELTEVVSKICDFGNRVQDKLTKYGSYFDFTLLTAKNADNSQDYWQDALIDPQIRSKINKQKQNGQRYMQILDQIFPTALQSPEQCLNRSIKALNRIKQLSKEQKCKNILIISHNRILKNMLTQGENLQKFQIMKNCEVRRICF